MIKIGRYRNINRQFLNRPYYLSRLKKTPTELQYVERSVFMRNVITQSFWTFELGTQEGIITPTLPSLVFNKEIGKVHKN